MVDHALKAMMQAERSMVNDVRLHQVLVPSAGFRCDFEAFTSPFHKLFVPLLCHALTLPSTSMFTLRCMTYMTLSRI